MENTQNYQQYLFQFQSLKQQLDMFTNQLEIVNASHGNLLNTKITIENMKNLKEDDEILVPIGGLINIKAKIKEPEKLLLYINQDVVIEKNLDSSIEYIDKLIEQHQSQENFLRTQIQNLEINLKRISQEIQLNSPQR